MLSWPPLTALMECIKLSNDIRVEKEAEEEKGGGGVGWVGEASVTRQHTNK